MFFLATIADTIRVEPHDFGKGDAKAIQSSINKKYPQKVLPSVGLVICLYDVLRVGAALIHPADGASHFELVFRVVVFKPFAGEIINGKIREATPEGLGVTLGFFDNVKIPYYNIFEPNHFSATRKAWIWDDHQNDGLEAEEPDPDSLLELRVGHGIRLQVEKIDFTDTNYSVKTGRGGASGQQQMMMDQRMKVLENVKLEPGAPIPTSSFDDGSGKGGSSGERLASTIGESLNGVMNGRESGGEGKKNNCFMTITGSVKDDGLGKAEWWEQEEGEEEEEE
jgi:DNA-directed RNA polymerase III subunit RPC8